MFKSKCIYPSLSCQHYCSHFSLKLQKSESALLGDTGRKSPSHSETLLFPPTDWDSEKRKLAITDSSNAELKRRCAAQKAMPYNTFFQVDWGCTECLNTLWNIHACFSCSEIARFKGPQVLKDHQKYRLGKDFITWKTDLPDSQVAQRKIA